MFLKNNFLQEIIISLILVILLVLFLNPFDFWMPDALLMIMILGLVVLFSIFASFIWRENERDEKKDEEQVDDANEEANDDSSSKENSPAPTGNGGKKKKKKNKKK